MKPGKQVPGVAVSSARPPGASWGPPLDSPPLDSPPLDSPPLDRPACLPAPQVESRLPLLPLFDAVLLPGGFVRVHIPAAWRKSAALVQHLLQQQSLPCKPRLGRHFTRRASKWGASCSQSSRRKKKGAAV